MRIDKYLKVSRLLKRREVAKELCLEGDIILNGKEAKPMSEVKVGDDIVLRLGRHELTVKVEKILEFATKDNASSMYTLISDKVVVQ
ncbi:MAG: RNA-binding S4 domain-containing protein [Bacilli bacterium]|nr:RNA-binding S4 domain-containing protein [Bacilli bacterium]